MGTMNHSPDDASLASAETSATVGLLPIDSWNLANPLPPGKSAEILTSRTSAGGLDSHSG